MTRINKTEPTFFTNAKKKVKSSHYVSSAWSELGKGKKNFKTELREYILLEEQNMLCAYCNQEIEENGTKSNTDHFKTRHLFPRETLNYENLLVSCKSKYHCENIKDKFGLTMADYVKIINPVIENPDDFFDYGIDGDILVKNGLSFTDKEKAEFTIEVFKLDNTSLTEDRKRVGKSLIYYLDCYELDDILNDINSYPNFIKAICPKLQQGVTP